ncbi:MAG: type I restriction endonuclease, partial [Microgenomates group bacterium]
MTPTELNEIKLVEIPAQRTFQELGYETLLGPSIHPGMPDAERNSLYEVLLKARLRKKLAQLNPNLPENVYDIAIKQLEGLSEPTLLENNRQLHQMLLAGVKVPYQEFGKTKYYAIK